MTFMIKVFFEVVTVAFILYGIYHEAELVAFEDRILASVKASLQGSKKQTAQKATGHSKTYTKAHAAEAQAFAAREARANAAEAARKAAARQNAGKKEVAGESKIIKFPHAA